MANRRSKILRILAAAWLLTMLFTTGNAALACSCIAHEPCDRSRYGNVDFAGEVLSRDLASRIIGQKAVYQVRVTETFRGTQKVGDVVSVHTGLGGGDCGYRFEIGHKYLIDGRSADGVLSTSICSMTSPLEQAELEIGILRLIAQHQPLPSMVGRVARSRGPANPEKMEGLAKILVSMLPAGEGQSWHARTNENGYYSFAHLPTGTYRVSLSLPQNLSPAYTSYTRVEDGKLPPIAINADSSTVCHTDIIVESSGGVSGVIRPAVGENDGWVNATAINAEGKLDHTVLSEPPSSDGSFHLNHLPPGRYQIQFTRRQAFKRGEPEIIELKDGERKTGLVLKAN
jgi:hypothetical protein